LAVYPIRLWLVIVALSLAGLICDLRMDTQVNVTQYHNHVKRDCLYVDPAFTHSAAAGLAHDLDFAAAICGEVYA
jgi:hypothetical protein